MGGRCVGWGGSLGVGYPMGEGLPWVSRGAPAVGCCILGGMVAWGGGGSHLWGVGFLGCPTFGGPHLGHPAKGGAPVWG